MQAGSIAMAGTGTRFARFASALADSLYVPVCVWCGRRGSWICDRCRSTVNPIRAPGCLRCGVRIGSLCECALLPPELDSLRSAYPFEGWVRAAIHKLKYEGERARADSLAESVFAVADYLRDADLIIPVPIHPNRLRRRGFNQAELIARRLAEKSGVPLVSALERVQDRGSQVGRPAAERWLAVEGAFACVDTLAVRNMNVVVFDDVITTGATISSCARALADAGAAEVRGLSMARG
jgi:competence protein ComFC